MKKINGHHLKQMIISGANNLYNHYPEIDSLNVFPVPDGDTGTNMNLTISSGSKEVVNLNNKNIGDVAKAFSKGLLMGARGNSGVILSQIFRGFANGLEGKEEADPSDLVEAFLQAKEVSYKAVMKPVEGTILTVIREAGQGLKNYIENSEKTYSIEETFSFFLTESEKSLERTPELLPVLKEVGVVDSGGAGLVKIFEGFNSALHGKIIDRKTPSLGKENQIISGISPISSDDHENYGYCTEFILRLMPENEEKKFFHEKRFINVLMNNGNSVAVVMDEDIVKVHIHTLRPGHVFNYAQQFGEFITLKIENMEEQHSHIIENVNKPKEKKKYGLISVGVGEGVVNLFEYLRADIVISGGQTMNPSTEDFIEAIEKLNAENIFIMPNNSNIILTAKQACDVVENVNCYVIPTKTIPQGMVACMMFNPEAEVMENNEEMNEAIKNVKTGQITFAIKDSKIDGLEIKQNHFMGLEDNKIVVSKEKILDTTKELVKKLINEDSEIITIIAGKDAKKSDTDKIVKFIEENFEIEVEVIEGKQPIYNYIFGIE